MNPEAIKKILSYFMLTVSIISICLSIYYVIDLIDDQNKKITELTTTTTALGGQVTRLTTENQALSSRLETIKSGLDQYAKDISANKAKTQTLVPKLTRDAIQQESKGDPVVATKIINDAYNTYIREINRETAN